MTNLARLALTRLATSKTYMWFWGRVLQPAPPDVPSPKLPRLRRAIATALMPLDHKLDHAVYPEEHEDCWCSHAG